MDGHLETVKWLVETDGCSINEKCEFGESALMVPAMNGHLDGKWMFSCLKRTNNWAFGFVEKKNFLKQYLDC